MRGTRLAVLASLFVALAASSSAQFLAPFPPDQLNHKAIPRPPAGSKVAIVVFEDLGCPACAAAHPLELKAAAEYHVPLMRYDFPIAAHVWTFNGAVCARYLEDKVDPALAAQYRTDVFAAQQLIAGKDDLTQFTRRWMQQHGRAMPFVLDPNGRLAAEVTSDRNLGLKLNLTHTPTILVVTADRYQMVCGSEALQDPTRLFPILKAAISQTGEVAKPRSTPSPRKRNAARSAT